MTNRLHPAVRPNPTLPTSIDGNTRADQAARFSVLDAWARHWGTRDELALLASSRGEARNLNLLARSTLRAAGRLAGPSVTAGDLELTPGDRVVAHGIGRPDGRGIPPGCPGDVRLVDPAAGAVIDFPHRRRRPPQPDLPPASLAGLRLRRPRPTRLRPTNGRPTTRHPRPPRRRDRLTPRPGHQRRRSP